MIYTTHVFLNWGVFKLLVPFAHIMTYGKLDVWDLNTSMTWGCECWPLPTWQLENPVSKKTGKACTNGRPSITTILEPTEQPPKTCFSWFSRIQVWKSFLLVNKNSGFPVSCFRTFRLNPTPRNKAHRWSEVLRASHHHISLLQRCYSAKATGNTHPGRLCWVVTPQLLWRFYRWLWLTSKILKNFGFCTKGILMVLKVLGAPWSTSKSWKLRPALCYFSKF